MIDNNSSDRNRFINGILIVVAIALLAASIYSVYLAWRTGLAQSRAETASRLMAIRTSPRSTETPGINAWVSWSLLNNQTAGSELENERLRSLVTPRSGSQFPREFQGLLNILRLPAPEPSGDITFKTDAEIGGSAGTAKLEFRSVNYIENQNHLFVLTARKNEAVQSDLEDYSNRVTSHLLQINQALKTSSALPKLDQLQRIQSARIARFYVLNEDESLISLPLVAPTRTNQSDSLDKTMYLSEGDEFRKNPLSPSFVSNNFFFNFQFEKPLESQATFSGMYLDLGGLGLVASVTIPVIYNGKRSVLGADIAFEMDWEEFAQALSPNLVSHVAHIQAADSQAWNPWSEFLQSAHSDNSNINPELKSELKALADRGALSADSYTRKSVYLATTRDGGDLMAIQVNRSTWLLLLVAANEIQLPWATILLTSLVFLSLLFRIEQSRRQAVVAQRSARGEMQEKQNLLETMQVPLMVVDPNTDEVVFCNRAAESIGMSQGSYFGKDVVSRDPESQRHYSQTQTLSEEHRRAYGVPICTQSSAEGSADYAIVRSVAVTAPIETLHADERHRLGILFLINEERDLSLLLKKRLVETRKDEKRQLSGLMNHGIDSLARILRNRLNLPPTAGTREAQTPHEQEIPFTQWLSSYLSERIQLMAWTLENWGQSPTATDQRIIERETVESTLNQFNHIFQIVAGDRRLREQLHWNNGVVSNPAIERADHGSSQPESRDFIESRVDWNHESCFAVPRDGVFGFFLSEVLINAVRHGQPGSPIRVEISENQIRNELNFRVDNSVNESDLPVAKPGSKPYGGTVIMSELARLSGWETPETGIEDGRFFVRWSIPAIRRKTNGQGD